MTTNYWLAKCEPEVYSIDDLKRDKRTLWEGVRNYQARNFLRDGWKKGDLVLFYHSNAEPSGIAGECKVSKEQIIDPTQFDKNSDYYDPASKKDAPRWYAPEVTFIKKYKELIPLETLRQEPKLKNMQLLKRGNRLSVLPLTKIEFEVIQGLA